MSPNLAEGALVHKKEKRYFVLCLLVSLGLYVALIVSVIGILWLVLLFGVPFVLHALAMAHLRKNGVRLSAHQFPRSTNASKPCAPTWGFPPCPTST